jgi:hypothetical protein
MGNIYGHVQWILDTIGVITTDKVRVRKMEWIPNAAGDDLVINDNNGESMWTVTDALAGGLAGAERIDFGDRGIDFLGFNLATLGGGTLYVWLG